MSTGRFTVEDVQAIIKKSRTPSGYLDEDVLTQNLNMVLERNEPKPRGQGLVNELERTIMRLCEEVKDWRASFWMYHDAWLREIGGVINRKSHKIDGFVLRTRDVIADAEKRGNRNLSKVLERDRTKVAECVTLVKRALHNYDWLITSRGSYEWNDDRWHEEFKRASENIWEAIQPMVKIAADWMLCPTDPKDIEDARAMPWPPPGSELEKIAKEAGQKK